LSYRTAKEGVRNWGFVCRGLTYSSDRYYALPTASYYTTTSLITTVSHDSCGGEVSCHPNNQSASLARVAARPELSKTTTLNRVSVDSALYNYKQFSVWNFDESLTTRSRSGCRYRADMDCAAGSWCFVGRRRTSVQFRRAPCRAVWWLIAVVLLLSVPSTVSPVQQVADANESLPRSSSSTVDQWVYFWRFLLNNATTVGHNNSYDNLYPPA